MNERSTAVEIGLNAAILAVSEGVPRLLAIASAQDVPPLDILPFGPFDPTIHRTFETSLRARVAEQTALKLGYIEQLYTFGDRGRYMAGIDGSHVVSVGYLALTRMDEECSETLAAAAGVTWRGWYAYFPWEDWRGGRPVMLDAMILPALDAWARRSEPGDDGGRPARRRSRMRLAFGLDGFPWDEERVLERYELLYEAGLIEEAVSDGRVTATGLDVSLGRAMSFDHRRIVATAIARLRGKIKYRPVVFEMLAPEFTLTRLQETVEAISGRHLHKQNFRRLVEGAELVEPTGATSAITGGRPAALYRFRRKILEERPAPGLKVGRG
ncbi:NUDIX hydrolase [Pararhizobium mangrovi]|uniref:NAD regulator n=1 Tax=Pararhizobium mangrovi TaxID=2590452 RepID=A0A506UH22_9HYPH|nr:NAD regulator [Pararhizobium mangrovi]TPW32007.1 NAD regulator [Pararhizobium mangrovi]